MALRSHFSLATFGAQVDVGSSPTIEAAREALGGRLATERGAGEVVIVSMKRGADANGVVVCVNGKSRDVWIGQGRFVRTSVERLRPLRDAIEDLDAVATDARRFAALREGDRVRALKRDGTMVDGVLAEKCRYGALVAKDDAVLAVSFRKVTAAPS